MQACNYCRLFGFVVCNKTAMQTHNQLQISVQFTVHLRWAYHRCEKRFLRSNVFFILKRPRSHHCILQLYLANKFLSHSRWLRTLTQSQEVTDRFLLAPSVCSRRQANGCGTHHLQHLHPARNLKHTHTHTVNAQIRLSSRRFGVTDKFRMISKRQS